MANLGLQ